MNLASIRIITNDIKHLAAFYEHITETPLKFYSDDFAELKTQSATLAIGTTKTLQLYGPSTIAFAAQNQSAIIEFKVADVDQQYARLSEYLEAGLVQKPTTMPWGNRSLLFRDPDGNLINFFTPVTTEAIKKADGDEIK